MSAVLFQIRDLAAATCGEPHVAPSWLIARRSLGALLAKTPDLAERAVSIVIENICDWDPEKGANLLFEPSFDREWHAFGDDCLKEYLDACRKEEEQGGSDPLPNEHYFPGPDSDNGAFDCSGVEVDDE